MYNPSKAKTVTVDNASSMQVLVEALTAVHWTEQESVTEAQRMLKRVLKLAEKYDPEFREALVKLYDLEDLT
jgi:hypothetical protein